MATFTGSHNCETNKNNNCRPSCKGKLDDLPSHGTQKHEKLVLRESEKLSSFFLPRQFLNSSLRYIAFLSEILYVFGNFTYRAKNLSYRSCFTLFR